MFLILGNYFLFGVLLFAHSLQGEENIRAKKVKRYFRRGRGL